MTMLKIKHEYGSKIYTVYDVKDGKFLIYDEVRKGEYDWVWVRQDSYVPAAECKTEEV